MATTYHRAQNRQAWRSLVETAMSTGQAYDNDVDVYMTGKGNRKFPATWRLTLLRHAVNTISITKFTS